MKTKKLEIIGIDPKPNSGAMVFGPGLGSNKSPGFEKMDYEGLKDFLHQKSKLPQVLICWDAPLTGYSDLLPKSFSDRVIDKALRKLVKDVKGVSVLPYSGCAHWAISRYMLGLPKTGPYDLEEVPFPLGESPRQFPRQIAEVHPAVAMYFWLDKEGMTKYKNLKESDQISTNGPLQGIWNQLSELPAFAGLRNIEVQNDDQLDALVAYVLGREWYKPESEVQILGNNRYGSMLLPGNGELWDRAQENYDYLVGKRTKAQR